MSEKINTSAMTMNLRDYFAAAALTGLVANGLYAKVEGSIKTTTETCYKLADAMLEERERGVTV